jgi:integrase
MPPLRRGRPARFSEYDQLVASLPPALGKRPRYLNGIGVSRGSRGLTAWLKLRLPHGGFLKGKTYAPNASVEIKVGSLNSWSWERLVAKYDELQGRADRGDPLEDAPDTAFAGYAHEWLVRAEGRIRKSSSDDMTIRKHLIPAFGKLGLRQISTAEINRWLAKRRLTAKPGTVQREFNTLRAILNDAVRSGLIEKTPTQNADPIRGAVARQRFLTRDELVVLLAAAEKQAEWLADFILWAVHSGMRRGEIQALNWPDIRELAPNHVIVDIRHSKSGQPRLVVATRTMRDILCRQTVRKVLGDERVFPISEMTLRRRWEAARRAVGLTDVTIHDLRRTHSTYAAISGVDLRTLAARIGHSDLSMLQKHYAAIVGSASEEAAEKIERVFAIRSC